MKAETSEASEVHSYVGNVGRQSPAKFRAGSRVHVKADAASYENLLLGGVTTHRSSRFESRKDAVSWCATVVEANLMADRRVGRVWITESVKEAEICRCLDTEEWEQEERKEPS